MSYNIELISRCGFSKAQLESMLSTLQSEMISEGGDGDSIVTSFNSPGLSISFDTGKAPQRSELIRAVRYALFLKDPSNPEYQDARIVRELRGITI
jgi:hypothetical protein